MFKKKSDEKQILLNNKNKALITNLIDQIEFLKNEFRSKDTTIKLIIENSKHNTSKIKIMMIVIKLKNSSHQKNLQNSKYQTIRVLATLHPSIILKYWRIIGDKGNQHNTQEDFISDSEC